MHRFSFAVLQLQSWQRDKPGSEGKGCSPVNVCALRLRRTCAKQNIKARTHPPAKRWMPVSLLGRMLASAEDDDDGIVTLDSVTRRSTVTVSRPTPVMPLPCWSLTLCSSIDTVVALMRPLVTFEEKAVSAASGVASIYPRLASPFRSLRLSLQVLCIY